MTRKNCCRVKWRQGGQRKRRKVCNVFKANFRPTKPYLSHVTAKAKVTVTVTVTVRVTVTRNPPPLQLSFDFSFTAPHSTPLFCLFTRSLPLKVRAHFGFWNRMRALANWIWLVCVQSSTWLQRLSSVFGCCRHSTLASSGAEKTCSCRENWQTHFAPFAISGEKFTLTLPVRLGLVFAIGCEMWHPLGEGEAQSRGKERGRCTVLWLFRFLATNRLHAESQVPHTAFRAKFSY